MDGGGGGSAGNFNPLAYMQITFLFWVLNTAQAVAGAGLLAVGRPGPGSGAGSGLGSGVGSGAGAKG